MTVRRHIVLVPLGALALAAFALAAGRLAVGQSGARAALALAAIVLLAGVCFLAPRYTLYLLVLGLPLLGLVRRALDPVAPSGGADLLLLVLPFALLALLVVAVERGALRRRTALSNAVLLLGVLLLLGAVNPLQGDMFGGIASLLLVAVPILAFWTGRALVSDATLTTVLKIVAAIAIPAALYGLLQTFDGFPSWDAAWVRESGYAALNVGGVVRPFSSFSSSAEYAYFAGVGLIVWFALAIRTTWTVPALAACGLLGTAVFYQSSRGVLILVVLSIVLMLAARLRVPAVVALGAGLVCVVAIPFGVSKFAPEQKAALTGAQILAAHQRSGLANPLDAESSTLLAHLNLIRDGIVSAVHEPLGTGLAPITNVGERLGEAQQHDLNTEADPSNVAVALGLPGLVVYCAVLVLGLGRAYALAVRRGDVLALAAFGVLTVTLFQWLNGGQYAVALLPWLVLGWLDRPATAASADAAVTGLLPRVGERR